MVKLSIFAFLLSTTLWAGEGMIVVLEAPMFRHPDRTSDVVQYTRKGQRIFVHPAVMVDRARYNDIPFSDKALKEKLADGDPMAISKDVADYHDGMDFILTKDKQGRDAWMLREHVHVFYEDQRERAQKDPYPDPTDYRLLEPLPDTFPIVRQERLRGGFSLSLGSPYSRNYPYNQKIKAEAAGYQLEAHGQMTRQLQIGGRGRWYGGGMVTVRTTQSRYTLETRRAAEQWTRLGAGGLLTMDAWRSDTQRITLTGALIAYPYSQANISQSDDGVEENRNFWGWNFGARTGAQWQRVRILAELDLVMGVWAELESPMRMQAKTSTNRPEWWGGSKSDTFNPNATFTFAGIVGLQSTY